MISLLCVDDKPGAIDHIRRDLEEKGDVSVTTLRSGEEALNLLKKQPFDIILSGREMPDMKGVDLLQAARESGCHTPFIFFDDFDDRNRASDSQDSEGRPTALLSCLSSIAAEQQIPDQSANRSEPLFQAIADKTDNGTIGYFTRPQTINGEITGRVWSFSNTTEEKEVEKNLKEREHFFTTLLEAIRDGVLILSENGTVRYANRAACELVGLPSTDDCVGRNILEFVHQDLAHAIFRDLLSVRGGSDSIPAEYTFVTPSGEVRQVEGLSSTITWKEKKAITVTLRDITERKQAEAAAHESADLNRALIDGLPEYIIVLTRDGEIIFANPAAEAAL
ncbi:PAS domain S-box protein [Methanofollis ethanolicus]|uniref:PAS domain S-box protein n=1 Tax=Methanofollis ethanolicus TaxID=488124 RepID=UPI000829C6B5|nr:PAS domain S-box protein [Methanofollis ethanolicus]